MSSGGTQSERALYLLGAQQKMERRLPETNARIAALPPEFQARFARFRAGSKTFERDHLAYELWCCEEAMVFVGYVQDAAREKMAGAGQRAAHTPEALRPAVDEVIGGVTSTESLYRAVPGLSDDHTGNTLGFARMIATTYLQRPHWVPHLHGALTVVTGCPAYGCTHDKAAWAAAQAIDDAEAARSAGGA